MKRFLVLFISTPVVAADVACTETFDYALAGQVWALAFTSVVSLFFLALGVSQVLRIIKKG